MTPASTPADIRQAVTTLLKGTSLHLDDIHGALVITNPGRPDRGEIGINRDGYVTWLREHSQLHGDQLDYFGTLEGITTGPAAQHRPPVPALMIIHLLTATTDPPPPDT